MGISVILPCRRLDDYLQEALSSTEKAMHGLASELIIVIPVGESDLKIYLQKYKSSLPHVDIQIIEIDKPGIVAALNLGIHESKYDLIARMDADDVMDPARLYLQSKFLESTPEIVILGSAVSVIDQSGINLRNVYFPASDKEIRKKIIFSNTFSHPSVMFKKSAFVLAGGYSKNFTAAEDYDLWTRIIDFGKAANITFPLIKYREHSNQISNLDRSLISKARLVIAFRFICRERFGTSKSEFIATEDEISIVASSIESLGIKEVLTQNSSLTEYFVCRAARSRECIGNALSATANGRRKWSLTIGYFIKGAFLSPKQILRIFSLLCRKLVHFHRFT